MYEIRGHVSYKVNFIFYLFIKVLDTVRFKKKCQLKLLIMLLRTHYNIRQFYKQCITYNELSQKTRFQLVPIAAMCLYNIQRVKTWFLKNLSVSYFVIFLDLYSAGVYTGPY